MAEEKGATNLTVAFHCPNKAAFDALWTNGLASKFFKEDADGNKAFAVSMGDLFAVVQAIEAVVEDTDLDGYERIECIRELIGSNDPAKVLADWEIKSLSESFGL